MAPADTPGSRRLCGAGLGRTAPARGQGGRGSRPALSSWKTSAPLYRDRGFTITKTSLVLKAGLKGRNVLVHPITRVKIAHSGEAMVYTIEYLVEQAGYEFSFRLWPGPPPEIRLVHQPAVAWRKEDNHSSPSSQAVHYR